MNKEKCLDKIKALNVGIQKLINEYAESVCPFKRNETIQFKDFSKNKREKGEGIILEIFGRYKYNDIEW